MVNAYYLFICHCYWPIIKGIFSDFLGVYLFFKMDIVMYLFVAYLPQGRIQDFFKRGHPQLKTDRTSAHKSNRPILCIFFA